MVLGYDELRPTKEAYDLVMNTFVSELSKNKIPVSVYVHGSYNTSHCVYGRSDVDLVLVLPEDIVSNKKLFLELNTAWKISREKSPRVPLQASPIDLKSAKSGRLNSFLKSYEVCLQEQSRRVYGDETIDDFLFLEQKSELDSKFSHQIRKMRLKYLDSIYNREYNYPEFIDHFDSALKSASSMSRDVTYYFTKTISSRFSSFETIKKQFSDIDFTLLDKIKFYFKDIEKYDALFRRSDEVYDMWTSALTLSESLAKKYLEETS